MSSACCCLLNYYFSLWWQVRHSCNGIGHVNKVQLCQAWLVQWLAPFGRWHDYHSCFLSSPLSLAISHWVGVMSTGDGFGYCWERNGKFYAKVAPSYQDSWHTGLLYASLIGSNPTIKGNELSHNIPHVLCVNLFVHVFLFLQCSCNLEHYCATYLHRFSAKCTICWIRFAVP